jgi:hypothetical protein
VCVFTSSLYPSSSTSPLRNRSPRHRHSVTLAIAFFLSFCYFLLCPSLGLHLERQLYPRSVVSSAASLYHRSTSLGSSKGRRRTPCKFRVASQSSSHPTSLGSKSILFSGILAAGLSWVLAAPCLVWRATFHKHCIQLGCHHREIHRGCEHGCRCSNVERPCSLVIEGSEPPTRLHRLTTTKKGCYRG